MPRINEHTFELNGEQYHLSYYEKPEIIKNGINLMVKPVLREYIETCELPIDLFNKNGNLETTNSLANKILQYFSVDQETKRNKSYFISKKNYETGEISENDLIQKRFILQDIKPIKNNQNLTFTRLNVNSNSSNYDDLKKIYYQKKSKFDKIKQLYTPGFSTTTFEDFKIWATKNNQVCHYCGLNNNESKLLYDIQRIGDRADGTRGGKRGKRLELDRKDPNESYDNLDNLVWCCYWCNNAKSNFFTENEFKPIGESIGLALKKIIENN